MPRRILILGGGGNGSVIAAAIGDANTRGDDQWSVTGYLDDRLALGTLIDGHPVVGKTADAPALVDEGYYFINTILRIDGQSERIAMFEGLCLPAERMATFVHPTAYAAQSATLAPGVVIMPQAAVSPGVVFGKGCLIMMAATVGHDSRLGDHCHLAAQACLGAYVQLSTGVHIGMNATVRENLSIGDGATLGMGAVLTKDMGAGEIWVGNPARLLRRAE